VKSILGFTPDVDSTTPGIITECANLIPFEAGMEGAPTGETLSDVPALISECYGAAVVTDLSGVRRILAGTATKLWELSSGVWTDVSGLVYGASLDKPWTIEQFGNTALASNRSNPIQRSTGGVFASIAGAPRAEVIFSVGAQVMALNVNDGADKQDGWHCSALNDDTDWTPSLTTQAASGRLVSTSGAIKAGARLGEYAVAYKAKSIYVGQYVGSPSIWDWVQAPGGSAGCVGPEALCDIGGSHFLVGEDNIWIFDGRTPIPVADHIRLWFYEDANPTYLYRTKCVFDKQANRVWVFYPSSSSETCDSAIVYHLLTKQWGRASRAIETTIQYVSPGVTYDTLNTVGATYQDLDGIPYNSQFWLAGGQALAVVSSSHRLQLLSGNPVNSSFTTGDVGDDEKLSCLHQIRLRYSQGYKPDTATVRLYYKMDSGDDVTQGITGDMLDGKFDVLQTARWHRAKFTFTGAVRVAGIDARTRPAGLR
jgi:hypothetical protein